MDSGIYLQQYATSANMWRQKQSEQNQQMRWALFLYELICRLVIAIFFFIIIKVYYNLPLLSLSKCDKGLIFVHFYFYRYGSFSSCQSDQGSEFNNAVVDKLFKLTGCHHKLSSQYHPQCNG